MNFISMKQYIFRWNTEVAIDSLSDVEETAVVDVIKNSGSDISGFWIGLVKWKWEWITSK